MREHVDQARCSLAMQILDNCRNELYSQYPYLDSAFAALPVRFLNEDTSVDGDSMVMNPAFLIETYAKEPERVRAGYLHMLLHCLYLHILPPFTGRPTEREKRLWNLACDLAVTGILEGSGEGLIDRLPEQGMGRQFLIAILERVKILKSAENIMAYLDSVVDASEDGASAKTVQIPEAEPDAGGCSDWSVDRKMVKSELELLEACFHFDQHEIWYETTQENREGLRRKWSQLLGKSMQKQGKRRGSERGFASEQLGEIHRSRYDYRRFLKRFAVIREEVELDLDSFDYIPYDYGMRYYGNLPFVEPLEYKEVHRLEELVIAIDTSSSCSTETVRRFLEETYAILNEKENFFRRFKVYLIQCDCFLQEISVIHNEEEWKAYARNVTIQGRSGTDFRPVFSYVEELRNNKELKNLKALIYFTDGDGIYPEKATDYETAFAFLKRNDYMDQVPSWASLLLLDLQNHS